MRAAAPLLLALLAGCGTAATEPLPPPPRCPAEPEVVETAPGCLRGASASGVHAFLGVPFAAPPVGALRLRPPAAPAAWSGVRDALAKGKACPQLQKLVDGTQLEWSEDCLTLNLWTPGLDAAAKRPVMVWIHGGGLANGSGGQALYDGELLARQGGVVVVTLNYRLAQLGYAAHPALSAEQGGRSGNYGLLDQLAALRWVQDHAARFGGDPARVTVFGESAGAVSTCALLASPRAAGLFSRAILESGGCPGWGTYARPLQASVAGVETAEAQGLRFAAALGCTGAGALECLRAKPAAELLAALPGTVGVLSAGEHYGLAVDGDALPDTPAARVAAGAINAAAVLTGTNADEGTIFSIGLGITTPAAYEYAIRAAFAAKADAVLARYPAAAYATPKAALDAVVTDAVFACPARRLVRQVAGGGAAAFLYQFVQVPSYATALGIGAFHGGEIDFVFGTLRSRARGTATAAELALSDAMLGYWTRFAAGGDPGGSGAAAWPRYQTAGDAHLTLGPAVAAGTGLKRADCDFWDAP